MGMTEEATLHWSHRMVCKQSGVIRDAYHWCRKMEGDGIGEIGGKDRGGNGKGMKGRGETRKRGAGYWGERWRKGGPALSKQALGSLPLMEGLWCGVKKTFNGYKQRIEVAALRVSAWELLLGLGWDTMELAFWMQAAAFESDLEGVTPSDKLPWGSSL